MIDNYEGCLQANSGSMWDYNTGKVAVMEKLDPSDLGKATFNKAYRQQLRQSIDSGKFVLSEAELKYCRINLTDLYHEYIKKPPHTTKYFRHQTELI